jgi:hypothetical protein
MITHLKLKQLKDSKSTTQLKSVNETKSTTNPWNETINKDRHSHILKASAKKGYPVPMRM